MYWKQKKSAEALFFHLEPLGVLFIHGAEALGADHSGNAAERHFL